MSHATFIPTPSIPRPGTRRFYQITPAGSGTGLVSVGESAIPGGTAAAVGPSATVPWQNHRYDTAATLDTQGLVTGTLILRWSQKPFYQGHVITGASIAVQRIWAGLAASSWASLLPLASPGTSGVSGAAFRYSTAVSDVNWQCVTFNGTSQTIVDSGVPVVAATAYKFEIEDNGTSTVFRINGAVVATITATRPAATIIARMGMGVQTLEAVVKGIAFTSMYAEID